MKDIRLSRRAETDLRKIRTYTVSQFGIEQADRYLSNIQEAFNILLTHPKAGKPADDVRKGYRMLGIGSHVIYYALNDDYIDIAAILHQRMNPILQLG